MGGIVIKGQGADRELAFEPAKPLTDADKRLIPNTEPTNFGVCNTMGAFRLVKTSDDSITLTPLPNEPPFSVSITTPFFMTGDFEIISHDSDGVELAKENVSAINGSLDVLLDSSKVFSYEVKRR